MHLEGWDSRTEAGKLALPDARRSPLRLKRIYFLQSAISQSVTNRSSVQRAGTQEQNW